MTPLEAAIERARAANVLSVAESLGARLKKVGGEWVGPCPRCGGRDRFAVNPGKGVFNCRGCGVGGDAIALARLVCGSSFTEAVELVNDDAPSFSTQRQRTSYVGARTDSRPNEKREATTSADALRLWREGVDPRDTPAETYLLSRRLKIGEDLAGEVLRWHPGFGALMALFRDIQTDEPRAVSRTFLDCEGRKLDRRFLGPTAGSAVKLDADDAALEGLHIAEGVETGMAARQFGLRPTWALGSAGAIAAFRVVAGIEALSILTDNDVNGVGERAAHAAEALWLVACREVRVLMRDKPGDINDALRELWSSR
jgi:hypothetical protein